MSESTQNNSVDRLTIRCMHSVTSISLSWHCTRQNCLDDKLQCIWNMKHYLSIHILTLDILPVKACSSRLTWMNQKWLGKQITANHIFWTRDAPNFCSAPRGPILAKFETGFGRFQHRCSAPVHVGYWWLNVPKVVSPLSDTMHSQWHQSGSTWCRKWIIIVLHKTCSSLMSSIPKKKVQ